MLRNKNHKVENFGKFYEKLYSTVQYSTVQYSTVQYRTEQYNTVQYSTIPYITVHYSTVQYSTVHMEQLDRKQSWRVRASDKQVRVVWKCSCRNLFVQDAQWAYIGALSQSFLQIRN